jgi:hypothetical protein
VFARDGFRQFAAVAVYQLAHAEEDFGTFRKRRRAPGGKGLLGGGYYLVYFLDTGEIDMGLRLAGGGVPHYTGAPGLRRGDFSVHPMADAV